MPVSTREERRQQRKLERQTSQRRSSRDATLRRNLFMGIAAVVVIAIAVVIVLLARRASAPAQPSVPGEVHFDDPLTARSTLYKHIPDSQPITTDPGSHYPPVFGDHYDTWRPPGIYDSPVPEGNFIHDLEHGGIVILYNCPSGCPDTVTQLRGLLTSLPRSSRFNEVKLVISPNGKIEHQLALLAWDWEKDLDSFDGAAIRAFYEAHLDRGPEQAQM